MRTVFFFYYFGTVHSGIFHGNVLSFQSSLLYLSRVAVNTLAELCVCVWFRMCFNVTEYLSEECITSTKRNVPCRSCLLLRTSVTLPSIQSLLDVVDYRVISAVFCLPQHISVIFNLVTVMWYVFVTKENVCG